MQKLGEEGLVNEKQLNDTVDLVKERIELIKQVPDTPLGREFKRIRQFCFNVNDKKKARFMRSNPQEDTK